MEAMDTPLATALGRIAEGDPVGAGAAAAEAVADDPTARLPSAVSEALGLAGRDASGGPVYAEPTAFEAFIEGGDNPALYRATIDALRGLDPEGPGSVIDIGCGDGRVTSAVAGPNTRRVHLVEPSAALLADATTAVRAAAPTAEITATEGGVELLLAADMAGQWQRAQTTFALSAVAPDQRPAVMSWLRSRVEVVAIVEFDVAPFADGSEEHIAYLIDRYERGLAEYPADSPVVQGFLLPVLLGQLDPRAPRHTFEQPVSAWCDDLAAAGFIDISHRPIHDYWWAPAHLITATGAA